MPRVPLHARSVEKLPLPKKGRIDYRDTRGAPVGFSVRVTAAGARSYYVTFKRNGVVYRHRLGSVEELSLSAAREMATDVRERLRKGENPARQRADERRAPNVPAPLALTFSALCGRYIGARENQGKLASSTASEYRRMTGQIGGADLGRLPAEAVTRVAVEDFLEAQALARGPIMANRFFQFVRAVLRWGTKKELVRGEAALVAHKLERPRAERSRDRALSDAEIVWLWRALEADPPVRAAAVRLLALLGSRTSETFSMRWKDLDLDDKDANPPRIQTWTIPGEFRKGGRLHVVPLPRLAREILRGLQTITGKKSLVLEGVPMDNKAKLRWWDGVLERVAAKAGSPVERFTKHDLRRTCATGCGRLGATQETISAVLGHRLIAGPAPAVTATYARHERLHEKATALEAWSGHIEGLLSGRRANVTPLTRQKRA